MKFQISASLLLTILIYFNRKAEVSNADGESSHCKELFMKLLKEMTEGEK